VRRIGQALLERRLSPERPLAILSGNDLEHALLARRPSCRSSLNSTLQPARCAVAQSMASQNDRRWTSTARIA
jgi:feruloyl-CoA synthase